MLKKTIGLVERANAAYLANFPPSACFERAVFFSWYCRIADCAYCYMSTQPRAVIENKKTARRSFESILAEMILCRRLGWDIGFLSGGQGAFSFREFRELLRLIYAATGERIWVNIGAVTKREMKAFLPYIKGVVGAIETVNPEIHGRVCPSKPVGPMEEMFKCAKDMGLERAMTVILGLGERISDFSLLDSFIRKHRISKIHFYGLNPHKGTIFEASPPPPADYQAEWIARTRIAFPRISIQCGIWADRVDRVPLLIKAGSNSVSKFPALRMFGSQEARKVEEGARKAGRSFIGTLTELPELESDRELKDSGLPLPLRKKVSAKFGQYLDSMRKRASA